MVELCKLISDTLVGLFRSRVLEAEILVLRHQLNVLRRKSAKRADIQRFRSADICQIVWHGAERAKRLGNRQARIGNPLAPRGFFACSGDGELLKLGIDVARRHDRMAIVKG